IGLRLEGFEPPTYGSVGNPCKPAATAAHRPIRLAPQQFTAKPGVVKGEEKGWGPMGRKSREKRGTATHSGERSPESKTPGGGSSPGGSVPPTRRGPTGDKDGRGRSPHPRPGPRSWPDRTPGPRKDSFFRPERRLGQL